LQGRDTTTIRTDLLDKTHLRLVTRRTIAKPFEQPGHTVSTPGVIGAASSRTFRSWDMALPNSPSDAWLEHFAVFAGPRSKRRERAIAAR